MAKHVLSRLRKLKTEPGKYADGGGLWLHVSPEGNRTWVFRWTKDGRRREMGVGPLKDKDGAGVSLDEAREIAAASRNLLKQGRDPIAEKRKEAEPTFGECVNLFLAAMENQWRNEKHRAQWRSTLENNCKVMTDVRVSEISTDHVLQVLTPIWVKVPETASRVRGRVERVLDYAAAKGWRNGSNPALWRGHLKNVLPQRSKLSRTNHAAMPYDDVPAFIARLGEHRALAARALELVILTAARSGEVLNATWSEIDFKTNIWTVPPARMKAGREHRVPLTDRAVHILKTLKEDARSDYIFPGYRKGRPLSNTAMIMLLRRMDLGHFTVHGFRSAFRDWVGDKTSFQREVAEQALAHIVGNKVEQSYRRSDALEKRRELMNAWSRYLEPVTDNVVKLKA